MLSMVPNINGLDYLLAVKRARTTVSNWNNLVMNAKENILDGYQRELTYVHDDGSFSAFGMNDKFGSTWLTAFVIKSFVQAKKYATIDNNVIAKAAKFLVSQQNAEGAFIENGNIIHKAMQGGVNSKETMTAYVAAALVEAGLEDKSVKESIQLAVSYLESKVANLKDTLSLGLVAYTLDLAGSSQAESTFSIFDSKATISPDGKKFWTVSSAKESSSDVEVTSYGLLMSLKHKDTSELVPIVKYLISKMSPSGGFSNTQDTVLGLKALTNFSLKLLDSESDNEISKDLSILVTVDKDKANQKVFAVNGENVNGLEY